MKLETRIRQSEVRARSGVRLVAVLAGVALVFAIFGPIWMAKIGGAVASFFALVMAIEAWNAWRLRKRLPPGPGQPGP